jgi:anti-sigma B factor antagonist
MGVMGLKVATHQVGEHTGVVDLQGEVDIYTAPQVKEAINLLLGNGCHQLVINLHRTNYFDSTGLGMLVGTLRRARERGGSVRLVSPTGSVRRLLEITRLTYSFPIDPSEEEACAHFTEVSH